MQPIEGSRMNADKAVNPSRALWEKGDFIEIVG